MKKLVDFLLILSVLFFASCNKDKEEVFQKPEQFNAIYDEKSIMKYNFGKSLGKALTDNSSMRTFIKTEALKMFNEDYDVLYELVKDEVLDNGKTFRNTLLSYFKSESELLAIEKAFPLLTIFVPELPENSFSAKNWNIDSQIPEIGIRLHTTNDVPMIKSNGEEYLLESQYIPSFPVIVIKENERVVSSLTNNLDEIKSTRILKSKSGISFKFTDDAFDHFLKHTINQREAVNLDPKLDQAFTTYQNADGWQRDYVYYNITPTSPNGQFSYDFQEHITSLKLEGHDARTAFNRIADQTGDPAAPLNLRNGSQTGWTDGFFEFRVVALINGSNGAGSTVVKQFTANPGDLFSLFYTRFLPFSVYTLQGMSFLQMNLSIPLINWDLNQYSSSIKITLEEVDLTETITQSETRSVKFATNFGIEGNVLKKIGLKFGASLERNESSTITYSVTRSSDPMGDVIVNFADKFILSRQQYVGFIGYQTREYSSGLYSISVEPKRVQ